MSNVNLEYFRKQAKRLLRDCRAGNRAAIGRLRSQLPRLNNIDPQELADQIKLADVQHALAHEQGFENWAELKQSDYSPVDQFLAAVRNGVLLRTKQHLDEIAGLVENSIHAACAIGDVDALRYHLVQNPSLLNVERAGWTPLLYACASPLCRLSSRYAGGILECVTLLLERGVDPNAFNLEDPTDPGKKIPASFRAATSGNTAVYWLLMKRAVAAGQVLKTIPQTPSAQSILGAFKSAFSSSEMRSLMSDIRDSLRLNPPPPASSFATYYDRRMGISPAATDVARRSFGLFLQHGVKPTNDANGPDFETPLHRIAVSGMSIEMARFLLEQGADPNVVRPDGRRPFELAVRNGNEEVAQLLLAHGAATGGLSLADTLLGACVRADSETARAVLATHPDLPGKITAEDFETIVQIAGRNRVDSMRLAAEIGIDVRAAGESGATPLHIAAWHGHAEMVRLLLSLGALVNLRDTAYRTSALGWAAHGSKNCRSADHDYCAVVTALLDAGAHHEAAVNRWGIPPERVCCEAVAQVLGGRP